MERNKCKHTRLVAELKNNNSFVYTSILSELDGHLIPCMKAIEKPRTIVSYCADCGIKVKEVEEK